MYFHTCTCVHVYEHNQFLDIYILSTYVYIDIYTYITETFNVSRSPKIAQTYEVSDSAEWGQQMGYQKDA